ncbi:MAG: methyltransferase domain-containing protein [Microthrixaceae bacterium]|nr:methyltransferase domain-containing protein [Microthrixaceae bacterium]
MPASDDPGRYGANFADVYDAWYPGGDEHLVVAHLAGHLPRGARVLELGVGTGRLALPLAAAGFDVVGLDASTEMLEAMERKDPAGSVHAVRADAGDPSGWDTAGVAGSFDGILAACNLVLNLASPSQQRACVTGAAVRLRVGGVLIVELQQIQPDTSGEVTYELSTAKGDAPVVMATQTDPVTLQRARRSHRAVRGRLEPDQVVVGVPDRCVDLGRMGRRLGPRARRAPRRLVGKPLAP